MFVHECLSDSLSFRLVQLQVEIKAYKLKLKRLNHVQSDSGKINVILKLKKQQQQKTNKNVVAELQVHTGDGLV